MKRSLSIISVIAVVILMVSCSGKQVYLGDKKVLMAVDTAGLAEFQSLKMQHGSSAIASNYKPVKTYASARRTSNPGKVQTGSMSTSNQYPAKAPKKGWSKAAKGVAIGAGSGAVLGAVINKRNRAVGAVIGGVAGGAVGYGIGRHMDKKDGRY